MDIYVKVWSSYQIRGNIRSIAVFIHEILADDRFITLSNLSHKSKCLEESSNITNLIVLKIRRWHISLFTSCYQCWYGGQSLIAFYCTNKHWTDAFSTPDKVIDVLLRISNLMSWYDEQHIGWQFQWSESKFIMNVGKTNSKRNQTLVTTAFWYWK